MTGLAQSPTQPIDQCYLLVSGTEQVYLESEFEKTTAARDRVTRSMFARSHVTPEYSVSVRDHVTSSLSKRRPRRRHRINLPIAQLISNRIPSFHTYESIAYISEAGLRALKAYIETKGSFIQRSSSPLAAASPILFVKKKDGILRSYAHFWALNQTSSLHQARSAVHTILS